MRSPDFLGFHFLYSHAVAPTLNAKKKDIRVLSAIKGTGPR